MTLLFIFMVILLIIPSRMYYLAYKRKESILRSSIYLKSKFVVANFLYSFAIILFIACFIHVLTINGEQVNDITQIERIHEETAVLDDYKLQLERNITATLKRYPEYEKETISGFDPKLLILNFPTLKSNETIMREFEAYDEADRSQKELLKEKLRLEARISSRQRNHVTNITWLLFNKQ